jgi:PAS domain S-box-containing protein
MKRPGMALAPGVEHEVDTLIKLLHATGQRLEKLTGGEVDAVSDGADHNFLLQHAQEQLRLREAQKQAAILDALPANLALLDATGRIASVNKAWRQFEPSDELLAPGHAVGSDYLATCDRAASGSSQAAAQAAAGIRSVLEGRQRVFSMEYACRSAIGQRWFLLNVAPLADDHSNGVVVMHVDVTAQRLSEESLGASELRFRQMAESIRDVFFLIDVQGGRMLYLSPAYEAILGRRCEVVYRNPLAWFEAIHPDDRAAASAAAVLGMSLGREYEYEARFVCGDGSIRWMAVRGFPVHDAGNTFVRMAGVAEDITNRKQAKEDLARTHAQLLKASRQAGMAEVATNILHNVGNVLNSVNVSAGLALEIVRGSRAPAMAKVVALIEEHAADLGSYVTSDPQGRHVPQLLSQYSRESLRQQDALAAELGALRSNIDHIKRIVAMQQAYAMVSGAAELVDVRDLVEDSLRMNGDDLASGQVDLVRRFGVVAPFSVEKHKVLQILVNTVRNAQQACAGPGVALRRITLGIAEAAGRVSISIADTGVGIAAENMVRIFSHGFTTRKGGHGFGLHGAALAAIELGGSLTAYSDGPGKGATFTLDLPATREAPGE